MKKRSEKGRKWIGRTAFVLATLAAAVAIYFCLDFVISDDTSSLSRVTILNYYKEEPVDIVFVGTSHSLFCIDAVRMTEKLDQSVYNLSTAGPDFVDLYYLLKEAVRTKDIHVAFVEIPISRLGLPGTEHSTYIISDYIKSLPNRTALILDGTDADSYMNGFFRLRRNLKVIPTVSEIKWLTRKKMEDQYIRNSGWDDYLGRGEWRGYGSYDWTIDYDLSEGFLLHEIVPKEWEYLTKVMDFCAQKGIKLVLYVMPYSAPYLIQFKDYGLIMDKVREQAETHSATFIDLNLVRDEFFHLDYDDFINADHLGTEAGDRLSDFLKDYIRDPDHDWFYDSLRDKYSENKVYGVGYRKSFVKNKDNSNKSTSEEGIILELLLRIEPLSFSALDVDVVLTELKYDSATDTWKDVYRYTAINRDEASSSFIVPYDLMEQPHYRIEVFRAGTNDLLFETESSFQGVE